MRQTDRQTDRQTGDQTNLERLSTSSKDLRRDHLAAIAQLFPQVMTESRDESGHLCQAIDFDKLKDLLSDELADGRESYEFTWVGKRDAMAEAGRPTTKTLRPDLDESVNFDETGNVFISGDNLEVLKILQESYLNKIDMIYIDPPYNTGKDFVYADNFAMTQDDLDEAMDSKDETGQRLFKNEKGNARYHSDWLSMMYPRLVLARNLLKESGVIFISIDDNEQANLKQLCDEVFGEENFVTQFIWRRSGTGGLRGLYPVDVHEYIVGYIKNKNLATKKWTSPYSEASLKAFSNKDENGIFKTQALYLTSLKQTDNQSYGIKTPDGKIVRPPQGVGAWRYIKETFDEELSKGNIIFKEVPNSPLTADSGKANYNIYTKQYISEEGTNPASILPDDIVGQTRSAKAALKKLFNKDIFEYSKPVSLLKYLIELINIPKDDGCILDFFAGSATTADAVMQLNAEDGGNRKYILCTLDEEVNEKSAAKEAGYETIDQISRERIRRVANKIREEHPDKADNLDFGFRAYRLDSSNYKDVYLTPDETQQNLFDSISNIKEDRTGLDLLHQVMLTWGMPLDLTIETETVGQATIYNVDDDSLIACFDQVDEAIVRQIAQQQPLRAIFLDESFANSSDKINVSEIFKELSPETKVKVV